MNSYFTTKRGRAVGLALAGTGVGQMVMPHVVRLLLDAYGFRSTVLLLGALCLHGVVGATLFQPVEWHLRKIPAANVDDDDEANVRQRLLPLNGRKGAAYTNVEIETQTPSTWWQQIVRSMNFKLLRDPVFCNIIIGLSLVYTASANFSMILPYFLQVSIDNMELSLDTYLFYVLGQRS